MGGSRPVIDLNADLGEEVGDDEALLELVTSANVACGYHAGGPATMRRVCERAVALGVVVGAHVSYLDREGFGRRPVEVGAAVLRAHVHEQLGTLAAAAGAAGGRVAYVKPHGALYHRACADAEVAGAVVAAVVAWDATAGVLALPGSALAAAAEAAGLPAWAEGYLDRAYHPDGNLVARSHPGAVLEDPEVITARAVGLALRQEVETIEGGTIRLRVASLCAHGDTPGAVASARAVRASLHAAGVEVRPFAGG